MKKVKGRKITYGREGKVNEGKEIEDSKGKDNKIWWGREGE